MESFWAENKADVKQGNLYAPPLFQKFPRKPKLSFLDAQSSIISSPSGGAFRGHFTHPRVWVSTVVEGLVAKIYS